MKPDDETLAAWIDGALDQNEAARMSELAANDEELAMRALRLQHLDHLVREAVPAEESVPQALLARLGLTDVPASASDYAGSLPAGTVINLADARSARNAHAEFSPGRPAKAQGVWLRVAAQAALIAGVGLAMAVWSAPGPNPAEPEANFHALANAPEAASLAANVLVKFAPGTGAAAARTIAQTAGVRLIGDPSSAGVWKAAVAPARREAALETLRADRRVSLAEPVDGARP